MLHAFCFTYVHTFSTFCSVYTFCTLSVLCMHTCCTRSVLKCVLYAHMLHVFCIQLYTFWTHSVLGLYTCVHTLCEVNNQLTRPTCVDVFSIESYWKYLWNVRILWIIQEYIVNTNVQLKLTCIQAYTRVHACVCIHAQKLAYMHAFLYTGVHI